MMEIQSWQQEVDQWIQKYGVRYFNEMTNALLLVEEVGEMIRHISRLYGEQSYKDPNEEKYAKEKISKEMADIFFVLTCLANQMDIDIEKALHHNMKKKTKRDKTRHINNPKLMK